MLDVLHVIYPARVEHQHLSHQLKALSVAPLQGHAQSTFPLNARRQCERDQRVVEEWANLLGMRVLRVTLFVLYLICKFLKVDAQEIWRPVVQVQDVCVERQLHVQVVQDQGLSEGACLILKGFRL
jgi:hypothetical protein